MNDVIPIAPGNSEGVAREVPTHSLFEERWWLDAVAPGSWDEAVVEEGGEILARLPYVMRSRRGLRVLTQPSLTQTLGPCIAGLPESGMKRMGKEKSRFGELIRQLPRFDIFQQRFHPNVTNWLPFHWDGFDQSTRYTYVLENLANLDAVFAGMDPATRNQIRKAEKTITVETSEGLDEVIAMAKKTYKRQGLDLPFSPELLHRIDDACKANGWRKALYGRDDSGRVHSAAYLVGDTRRAYLLVTGADPELRKSSSGSLVHWAAIQAAAQQTNVFDFEGSMIEPVESFYRSFGANQVAYSSLTKYSARARPLVMLRQLVSR